MNIKELVDHLERLERAIAEGVDSMVMDSLRGANFYARLAGSRGSPARCVREIGSLPPDQWEVPNTDSGERKL